MLVIDAGSSGTRMNAFTWRPPPSFGSIPVLEPISPDAAPHKVPRRSLETRRAYKRVETEPGMDKFAQNLHELGRRALEPLLEWAREVVPSKRWSSTPVFLLGTAGLRKLTEEDRGRVLDEARHVLQQSGFRFEAPWARILGGSDEGIFAWVALNAAAGTFGTDRTMGALDLGGSSLQVTFSLNDDIGRSALVSHAPHAAVNISILGTQSTLYTHSHYHFGLDDAFERSVRILMEKQQAKQTPPIVKIDHKQVKGGKGGKNGVNGAAVVDSTTMTTANSGRNLGKRRSLQSADRKESDGLLLEIEHPCLHQGYRAQYHRIPFGGHTPIPESVVLVGRPDRAACRRLATQVVTASTECDSPPCALGAPQPRAAGRFIALAGFYVVSHFFNLGSTAGVSALRSAGEAFCPLTWSEVQTRHVGEMAVETYCFRAAYIDSLISQGLGLKEDQVEIGEGTAGWTMGAALVEGHRQAGLGAPGGASAAVSIHARARWTSIAPLVYSRTAALVLGVLALAAIVLAVKRTHEAVIRGLRARGWIQLRRRSSSGVLSAAEFAGMPQIGNGSSSSDMHGNMFYQMFGNSKGKKVTPNGAGGGGIGWQGGADGDANPLESIAAVGSGNSVARGLTRTATFSRRLSALESGSGDR